MTQQQITWYMREQARRQAMFAALAAGRGAGGSSEDAKADEDQIDEGVKLDEGVKANESQADEDQADENAETDEDQAEENA